MWLPILLYSKLIIKSIKNSKKMLNCFMVDKEKNKTKKEGWLKMTKKRNLITKKEVQVGTIFEVRDREDAWAIPGPIKAGTKLIVVTPPKHSHSIVWKIEGGAREYTSYWTDFKISTNYVSGKKEVITEVLSSGKFNGFDAFITNFEKSNRYLSTEDDFLAIATAKFDLFLDGEISKGKRVTTKIINKIKNSKGFKEELAKQFEAAMYDKIDGKVTLPRSAGDYVYFDTKYSGRNVEVSISLAETTEKTLETFSVFLEKFQKAKATSIKHFEDLR